MIKTCFGEILISWSPLEVLLRKSLIFMPVGLKLLASSNGLFLQETCQKCYQYLCKTAKFPISYRPGLSSCHFSHTARRPTFQNFWKLHTAQQQGTHFDTDRLAGKGYTLHKFILVFRLKNETSVTSLLQTWDVLAKRHQSLLHTLSNAAVRHSRIKAWEHTHAARISSSPLPAHSMNPLDFASHRPHVPFYTPPYIPFMLRQFLPPLVL